MTVANNVAAKLGVAFVAVAMAISAFAPAAQAQTVDELQAQVQQLTQLIATLQAQLGTGSTGGAAVGGSTATVCPYVWQRDLSMGATGADVMALQQFLNSDADTRVAAAGAVGSAGMETSYFGPATGAAVAKFQAKYRAEILSPIGLVNPTQYFGAGSRAQANALCSATIPTTPTTPTTPDDGEEEEEEEDEFELGGEADLDSVEVDDASDTTIEEGDEDVEIGVITIEFSNGDAEIDRIDVGLDRTGSGGEQDPWDTFETVSLWVDGDMIAEARADRRSDYINENNGRLRFSSLDLIAMEDEEVEVIVAATINGSVRNIDTSTGDEWELSFDGIRYFDADGVATTEGTTFTSETAVFTIEEAGQGEELNVSLSSSNPDATDIVVDTDSNTNDVTIMEFDIEAEDGDIELRTLVVRVNTPGASTTDVVRDIELVIDGQTFRDESIGTLANGRSQLVTSAGEAVWYLFDIDGDIVIDEDEEVTVEVVVDFNSQTGNYANGQLITALVGSDEKNAWVAEGANDLTGSDISGTATGKTHTLVAEGLVADRESFEDSFTTQGTEGTIGVFTIEFDVTAVEKDFYVAANAGTSTVVSSTTGGVRFAVEGPGSPVVTSASLDSTADEETTDVFTVREGETETFTVVVTVDASVAGQHRITLGTLFYSEATTGVGTIAQRDEYAFTPVTDFRTTFRNINQ